MTGSVRVLLFGNDAHLQISRELVLESAGCKAYIASSVLALNNILAEHPIDLLILCHSLSTKECERARSISLKLRPKIKVLMLATNDLVSHSVEGDPVVDAMAGPRTLLATVEALMTKRKPPESPTGDRTAGSRAGIRIT
jgi:DNA-binding response OmpR family regulator